MDEIFKTLYRRHKTPRQVQRFLRDFPYNQEKSQETQRSALGAYKSGRLHCLEAALFAAAILEKGGYPPLVLSLESKDELDHVVFIFKAKTGWGAVGKSRFEGLHGRQPIFRTVRDLAWSYFDPFVDKTGRITGYAVTHLDESKSDWRFSKRNVWKLVDFLIQLRHTRLRSSQARYLRSLRHFQETGEVGWRQPYWW